jgi:hypothetical protein
MLERLASKALLGEPFGEVAAYRRLWGFAAKEDITVVERRRARRNGLAAKSVRVTATSETSSSHIEPPKQYPNGNCAGVSCLKLSAAFHKDGDAPRAARRPDGKARRLRISGIFEGATQPAGMHRRPNATVFLKVST